MSKNVAASGAAAALLAACVSAQAADRPAFAAHRYDEDWRSHCAAATPAGIDRLKCLHLGGITLLSLGGEWRERVEAVDKPDFGVDSVSDGYVLHRLLLHGDLRYGDGLRLFAQIGSLHQSGRRGGPASTDADDADIQQGFVDVATGVGDGRVRLRIGRQEFTLGSSRLISSRESPNARRGFDGLRLGWERGGHALEAFYLRPVLIHRGTLDNRPASSEQLWGLEWTIEASSKANGAEFYYLDFRSDDVAYVGATAREHRYSVGTRLFGRRGSLDWNIELIGQAGEWGQRKIRAWTFASDTGLTFSHIAGAPRVSLKANIASGDDDAGDNRLKTFNALYPNPTYFSEASLIAPANIIDVQPTVSTAIGRRVRLTTGWDFLWKHRRADAVYTPPASPLPSSDSGARRIGDQIHLSVQYTPSRPWLIRTAWVRFHVSDAVRQAGGRDVNYWTASVAYRF